jgi:hypothetical protein
MAPSFSRPQQRRRCEHAVERVDRGAVSNQNSCSFGVTGHRGAM